MKKSLLFLLVFFTVSAGTISAQRVGEVRLENPKREFNYGFFTVSGGAQVYYGDYTSHQKFGDRISAVMDVSMGKMFNPYIGARLHWTGWNANGVGPIGSRYDNGVAIREYPNQFHETSFHLNYASVDFMWNLSNTFGGPKESRFWDFVPYVGVGWASVTKDGNSPKHRMGVNAGILQQFRVSPSVDILLDVSTMFTNPNIDGVKHLERNDPSTFDKTLTASLGIAYNFGRARTVVVGEDVDLGPYNSRISALERDLSASEARANRLANELDAERAKEKTVVNNYSVASNLAVWFPIGQSTLTEQEKINLGYIADAMKKGDSNKVYTIYGSADKQTGSPVINQRLSERRAQAVYDELVKNGVSASQLRMNPVGDTRAEFDKPILNRVAIVQN